jgi:hypothetical protein
MKHAKRHEILENRHRHDDHAGLKVIRPYMSSILSNAAVSSFGEQ